MSRYSTRRSGRPACSSTQVDSADVRAPLDQAPLATMPRNSSFALAVDAALESSRRSPRTGQLVELKRSKAEVRRKAVEPYRYQVVYAVYADRILVLAVAHNSRRPLYWRQRIPR